MKYLILTLIISIIAIENSYTQWEPIPGVQVVCNTAVLADSSTIWGGGPNGNIFKFNISSNEIEHHQFNEDLNIFNVYPLNDSSLILAGKNEAQRNGFFYLYRTDIDSFTVRTGFQHSIYDTEFFNKDTGFATGFPGLFKTMDKGNSWDQIWDFTLIGAQYGMLLSITSISDSIFYATGQKREDIVGWSGTQGVIIRSENIGETWKKVFEASGGKISNIECKKGIVYCHDKIQLAIYMSEDSGESWTTINVPFIHSGLRLTDVAFLNANEIVVSITEEVFLTKKSDLASNVILYSPDRGKTWYNQYESGKEYKLNTLVNVNDSLTYVFGWDLALVTQNKANDGQLISYNDLSPTQKKINIFPVPAKDQLYVEGINQATAYQILSLSGKVLSSGKINSGDRMKISLAEFEQGTYIIKFNRNNRFLFSKLFYKQ